MRNLFHHTHAGFIRIPLAAALGSLAAGVLLLVTALAMRPGAAPGEKPGRADELSKAEKRAAKLQAQQRQVEKALKRKSAEYQRRKAAADQQAQQTAQQEKRLEQVKSERAAKRKAALEEFVQRIKEIE